MSRPVVTQARWTVIQRVLRQTPIADIDRFLTVNPHTVEINAYLDRFYDLEASQ